MISNEYWVRQAKILLRMSKIVNDPAISGPLAAKAADVAARLEEPSPVPLGPDGAKTIPPPTNET